MHAAIDDVHHRHRQHLRLRAADIAIERKARAFRRRLRDRQRHAEDRVRAEALLVRRAVERAHHAIEPRLVFRVHAAERVEDLAVHRGDGFLDALAAIALAAVAQFHRFMRAGRGAGGNRSAAERAVFETDIDFDRRVAAGIEDFAGDDIDDGGHGRGPVTKWAKFPASRRCGAL